MSDLISRSEVIKILKDCNLDETLFEKDIFYKIRNLPTAYDIDKVVEELEENYFQDGIKNPMCIELDKAIEIVKHGGVRKDVE